VEEFVEAESGTEGACILVSGYARHYAGLLNPHRQHGRDNSTCSICKSAPEMLLHALAEYAHACMFWSEAREILDVKLPRLHPDTWVADILCKSWWTQEERAKVITVMWSIWSSRNRWTHGEKGFDPSVAIKAVHETLLELELPPKNKAPKEARPECTW
jgi:hypothetical protein